MKSRIIIFLIIAVSVIVIIFTSSQQESVINPNYQEATLDAGIFFFMVVGVLYRSRKIYKEEKVSKDF